MHRDRRQMPRKRDEEEEDASTSGRTRATASQASAYEEADDSANTTTRATINTTCRAPTSTADLVDASTSSITTDAASQASAYEEADECANTETRATINTTCRASCSPVYKNLCRAPCSAANNNPCSGPCAVDNRSCKRPCSAAVHTTGGTSSPTIATDATTMTEDVPDVPDLAYISTTRSTIITTSSSDVIYSPTSITWSGNMTGTTDSTIPVPTMSVSTMTEDVPDEPDHADISTTRSTIITTSSVDAIYSMTYMGWGRNMTDTADANTPVTTGTSTSVEIKTMAVPDTNEGELIYMNPSDLLASEMVITMPSSSVTSTSGLTVDHFSTVTLDFINPADQFTSEVGLVEDVDRSTELNTTEEKDQKRDASQK